MKKQKIGYIARVRINKKRIIVGNRIHEEKHAAENALNMFIKSQLTLNPSMITSREIKTVYIKNKKN
jgi:hypothetical protein